MKVPLHSVIIPSARPGNTSALLKSLTLQTVGIEKLEILVVTPDPASVQEPQDHSSIHVIKVDTLLPPGKMRNLGVSQARGELLYFIDDDCIPPLNWVERMAEVISKEEARAAVGCQVISIDRRFWPVCADYSLFSCCQYDEETEIEVGAGALVVKKEAFVVEGEFDESLEASEDWEFCLRLKQSGRKTIFSPSVTVYHDHKRDTFGKIIKSSFYSGFKSGLIVQIRHFQTVSWLAKLSVLMKSPLLYWILILPYSAAVTLVLGIQLLWTNQMFFFYLPTIFLSRLAYHFGVWVKLLSEER